jgi:hypothetical protein
MAMNKNIKTIGTRRNTRQQDHGDQEGKSLQVTRFLLFECSKLGSTLDLNHQSN